MLERRRITSDYSRKLKHMSNYEVDITEEFLIIQENISRENFQ